MGDVGVAEPQRREKAHFRAGGIRTALIDRDQHEICRSWRGRPEDEGEIGGAVDAAFIDIGRRKCCLPDAGEGVEHGGSADHGLFVLGLAGIVIGPAGDRKAEGLSIEF